jgi:AcrR family transcriptional regulator
MSSPARPDEPGELIWLREEPGARRPTHSRAQIAAAAIEIADHEGFEAVSMRRVAHELNAGTMTLYHYVRGKDELVTLMHDAVMGEVLVPDAELPEDWREALAAIAARSRDAFARHPWTLDRIGDVSIGPNAIRHFEQSLQAVAGTGLPAAERLHVLSLVDEFVMGYTMREHVDWTGDYAASPDDWRETAIGFFQHELDTGRFPQIERLMAEELDEPDPQAATMKVMETIADPARFERGLRQLLDGVAASIERSGARPTRRRRRG